MQLRNRKIGSPEAEPNQGASTSTTNNVVDLESDNHDDQNEGSTLASNTGSVNPNLQIRSRNLANPQSQLNQNASPSPGNGFNDIDSDSTADESTFASDPRTWKMHWTWYSEMTDNLEKKGKLLPRTPCDCSNFLATFDEDEVLSQGLDKTLLTDLSARADKVIKSCAGRALLWRRDHAKYMKGFIEHRKFLAEQNILNPDRAPSVRSAGGMMRKEVTEGQSDEFKAWLQERYDYDNTVRNNVMACENFEKVWGDNLATAKHIKKTATYIYKVVEKLEAEWRNVLTGYPREQEMTNTDAEVLEYASVVLEKRWSELRELEKAIEMPVEIDEADEKTKWKYSPLSQYMLYTAN
jgi:hypothetical protein